MKKLLIATGAIVFLFFLCLLLVPMMLQEKILEMVEDELDASLASEWSFDRESFELSALRNFPHLSAGFGEILLRGKEQQRDDTILYARSARVVLSTWKLLSGETPPVKKIMLYAPSLHLHQRKGLPPNWDILAFKEKATEKPGKATSHEPPEPLFIELEMESGSLDIIDEPAKTKLRIRGADVKIKGSMDEQSWTIDIADISFQKNGRTWINRSALSLHIPEVGFSSAEGYSIDEGRVQIDELKVDIKGKMKEGNVEFEFGNEELALGEMVSILPMISKGESECSGLASLHGKFNGSIAQGSHPQWSAGIKIEDGQINAPELESPFSEINIDLEINRSGDKLQINSKEFHMLAGDDPIDFKGLIESDSILRLDISVDSRFHISQLKSFYPVEGVDIDGELVISGFAKGQFSKGRIPEMDVNVEMKDGYANSSEIQGGIEKINMISRLRSQDDQPSSFRFELPNFGFTHGGESLEINGSLIDYDRLIFDLNIVGEIDLGTLNQLVPHRENEISGLISTRINGKGEYDDIKNEEYQQVSLSGKIDLSNIKLKSSRLQKPLMLQSGNISIKPGILRLNSIKGSIGNSDFLIGGNLKGFLGYLLEGKDLRGDITANSQYLDLDEFRTSRSKKPQQHGPSTPGQEEAKSGDLILKVSGNANTVRFNGIPLSGFRATLEHDRGSNRISNIFGNALQGQVKGNITMEEGSAEKRKFSLDLGLDNIDIHALFMAMGSPLASIPAGQNMTGTADSKFLVDGFLDPEGRPIENSLRGGGSISFNNASIRNFDLIREMVRTVRIPGLSNWVRDEYRLSDFSARGEFLNGRIYFDEFRVELDGHPFTFFGSYGLKGNMDYLVATEFKPASLGTMANLAIGALMGGNYDPDNPLEVDFKVFGENKNPSVHLLSIKPKGRTGEASDPMEVAKKELLERKKADEAASQKIFRELDSDFR